MTVQSWSSSSGAWYRANRTGLVLKTPPATEPVSVQEFADYQRIDDVTEPGLAELITAAREWVEGYTARQLITATYTLTMDRFPWGGSTILVPRPPLLSVTQIDYTDPAGDPQVLTDYAEDPAGGNNWGRVVPLLCSSWPDTQTCLINAVEVTFDAGYGPADSDVPQVFRQAIQMLAGHWYCHRSAVSNKQTYEVPFAVSALLSPRRMWAV